MKTGVELRGEGGRFERYVLVRELQGRHVPTWLAHGHAPEGVELVVLERYRGLAAPARDALAEDAKRLESFRHPNLPHIRDVSRAGADLLVATEFVEGELIGGLRDLAKEAGKLLPIDVGVRSVVDVLAGLSALHGMEKTPMVHGDVGPQTILLGFDGVTRLLRPYRGRVLAALADGSSVQYLAPEQLRTGKGSARADLYPVGVLLWEVLSEKRLFDGVTREGRLARATAPLPKAVPHADAAWAAPLAAVAERALASDPQSRYGSAAEMAAAVRLVVRSKLAMPPRVADIVDRYAGAKVQTRRGELALTQTPPSSTGERRSVRPPVPAGAAKVLQAMRPASRPPGPMTPIPPEAVTVPSLVNVPKAPLVPRMGSRPAIAPIELTPPPPSAEPVELFEEFPHEAVTAVSPTAPPNGAKPATAVVVAKPAVAVVAKPAVAVVAKPAVPPKAAPAPAPAPPPAPVSAPVSAEPISAEPISAEVLFSVSEPPPPAEATEVAAPALARPVTAPFPFSAPEFSAPAPVPAPALAAPAPATTGPAPALSPPATAIVTPAPAMRDEELDVPPPPARTPPNTRRIVAIALLLCVLLIAAAGIRKVLSSPSGTVPVATGTAATAPTATGLATVTATVTATGLPLPSATGTGTEPEPSASASASAVPTGWVAPRPSNSTARPKPTYDPEGI